jgi:hypothetical protein
MGARLFFGLESRALSLDLEGRADLPAAGPAQARGLRVRSWLYAGAIVPCLRLGFLYGCGVASIGSLTAMSVDGVATSRTNSGLWAAVGGRLGAQIPVVDPLVVRGWVEVLGVLNRDMLTVDRTPVYTFPAASGTAAIAVAWRFL